MTLLKENETVLNGDTYFLVVIKDKIIINCEYEGVCVFDSSLQFLRRIDIIPNLSIYNAFTINEEELLLNCIENNAIFLVNIKTGVVRTCYTPQIVYDEILKEVVNIEEKNVVLSTYKHHHFSLDLDSLKFTSVDRTKENTGREPIINYDTVILGDKIIHMDEYKIIVSEKRKDYIIYPENGFIFLRLAAIECLPIYKVIVLCGSKDNTVTSLISYSL